MLLQQEQGLYSKEPRLTRSSITEVAALHSDKHLSLAVEYVKSGQLVGFQMGGVTGFLADATKPEMIDKILRLKNDDNKARPFSSMISTHRFANLIDKNLVNGKVVELLENPKNFSARIGSLCHIRAPLTQEATKYLPSPVVSFTESIPYMHNLDVTSHRLDILVKKLETDGVLHICVTTINDHGKPEIPSAMEAIEFLNQKKHIAQVPLFLSDPNYKEEIGKGSISIVDITKRDDGKLSGVRHGRVPFDLIEKLFEIEIDTTKAKPAAFPNIEFPKYEKQMSPEDLRILTLGLLYSTE